MSAIPGWDDDRIRQHARALDLFAKEQDGTFNSSYMAWSALCGSAAIYHCMALTRPSAAPKPRIEWVPFLRALGRISAKFPAARFEKVIKDRRNGAIVIVTDTSRTVEPDSHGMVEVLIEDES